MVALAVARALCRFLRPRGGKRVRAQEPLGFISKKRRMSCAARSELEAELNGVAATSGRLPPELWTRLVGFAQTAVAKWSERENDDAAAAATKGDFLQALAFIEAGVNAVARTGDDAQLCAVLASLVAMGDAQLELQSIPFVSVLVKSVRKVATAVRNKALLDAGQVLQPVAIRAMLAAQDGASAKLVGFLVGQLAHLVALRLAHTDLVLEDLCTVLDLASRLAEVASLPSTASFATALAVSMEHYALVPSSLSPAALEALLDASRHSRAFLDLCAAAPACRQPACRNALERHLASALAPGDLLARLASSDETVAACAARALTPEARALLPAACMDALTAELASHWIARRPLRGDEHSVGAVLARAAWASNASACVGAIRTVLARRRRLDLSAAAALCFCAHAGADCLDAQAAADMAGEPWMDALLAGAADIDRDALGDVVVECALNVHALRLLARPSASSQAAVVLAVRNLATCPSAALHALGCAALAGWSPEQLAGVLTGFPPSTLLGAHALRTFAHRVVASGVLADARPHVSALAKMAAVLLANAAHEALCDVLQGCGGLSDAQLQSVLLVEARAGFASALGARSAREPTAAREPLAALAAQPLVSASSATAAVTLRFAGAVETLRRECAAITRLSELRELRAGCEEALAACEKRCRVE